jgi:hypothetical protein
VDEGVVDIGMLRCVPGVLLDSVHVSTSSASDIEEVSSARAPLFATLTVGAGGLALSVDADVVVTTGRSSPVSAASRICVDSGTPAVLTQGRTVKCLFGRSRTKDQLKHR